MKYGRYEIIRELGMGSMGVVYEAHDPRIGRRVTLKVLRLDRLQDEAFVNRFLKEARAIGRLSHPNIVKIFDAGEDCGTIYIAMEYIEGRPLCDLMRERRFSLQEIVNLGIQICETLGYAHLNGVVHRDIKPSNTIIQPDGRIKITDFGVARIESPMELLQTQDGEILGTPAYMSPEQVLGKPVDGRSDLFSLGVMLYELSTGMRPFGREGKGLGTIFNEIVNSHPPVPGRSNPEIASWFSETVMKAMSKSPEERFGSGWAMANALRGSCEKERGNSTIEGAKPAVQSRTRNLLVLMILLLTVMGAGFMAAFSLNAEFASDSGVNTREDRQCMVLLEKSQEMRRQTDAQLYQGESQWEACESQLENAGNGAVEAKSKQLRLLAWLAWTLFAIGGSAGFAAGLSLQRKRGRREPLMGAKAGGLILKTTGAFSSRFLHCLTKNIVEGVKKRNGKFVSHAILLEPVIQLSPKSAHLKEEPGAQKPLLAVLSRELRAGVNNAPQPSAERVFSLSEEAKEKTSASVHEELTMGSSSFSVSHLPSSVSLARCVQAVWEVALIIMNDVGLKQALGIVLGAASGAPSLGGRNRYRLLAAKLCIKAERPDLARPILEDLYSLVGDLHLELWESPGWIAEVFRTFYECLLMGEPSDEDTLRAAELYGRLTVVEQTLEGIRLEN